ncbi:MAG: hypothetical protein WCF57_03525 [Pyrinomonadaceae bacterium]
MASEALERLLDQLDELKRRFDARDRTRAVHLLERLARRRFTDALSLIRFHEILLFMRAYPQNPAMLRQVEEALATFPRRVEMLRRAGVDLSPFEEGEVSGIAGTSLTASFSYPVARWLARRHAAEVSIDWEGYEDEARLGRTLPRFVPLLEEDAIVEANVPFLNWLRAATAGRERSLSWLIDRFERLALDESQKAELYDSLKLYVHWQPREFRVTRTGMKRAVRKVFYHDQPLQRRSDVSLLAELESPPLPLKRLSRSEGEAVLAMIRDTSALRYREVLGFTYGDAGSVLRADAGRGVEFFFNGVLPEHRVPLRACHSAFMFKNGVPVGYAEGLSLFERMEFGFNLYYTFRDGESAWLYARILRLFRQALGVTVFSVDPYQIGFENEEGIASGAFWFYRKLGFRPTLGESMKIALGEERKMTARPDYRTSPRILRRISASHLLFETPPSTESDWDSFQIRNLGLAVNRRMAARFDGDAEKIRASSVGAVERALDINTQRWKEAERLSFGNLALVLALIPGLARWTDDEKSALARIARAKGGADESRYLRLLQKHRKLRDAVIKIGSRS